MSGILMTQNSTFIIGPVSTLLGFLMNGIFNCLNLIGIPNTGLSIIIFTVVIYMCLMPLTIKQQKFSKLSAKMNPEIQALQKKYKGKKDNESVMAMNEEQKQIYAKYGVSPYGSCLQLLIQMPILFALYRVIYSMPAYVGKIKDAFFPLVDEVIAQNGSSDFIQTFSAAAYFKKQFTNEAFLAGDTTYVENTFIDVMNRFSTADWNTLSSQYSSLSDHVNQTVSTLDRYNNFLSLNIGNSPMYTMKDAFSNHNYIMVVAAILIPVLAAVTQWLNTKLMPVQDQNNNNGPQSDTQSAMMSSMKTMNVTMPIFSAVFCFQLPAGMGLYWIAGSVIRSIQQIFVNKHIDKIDWDEEIKKNQEKNKKKLEKQGVYAQNVNKYSNMNTRTISSAANMNTKSGLSQKEKENAYQNAVNNSKTAKSGSLTAKANMVREYNEKNSKN